MQTAKQMIEFSIKSGHPEKQRTGCMILGVYNNRRLSPSAMVIDEVMDGYLSKVLRRGDLEGKMGQHLLLSNPEGISAERVLLLGCGRERELGDKNYHKLWQHCIKTLNNLGVTEATSYLPQLNVTGRSVYWRIRHAIEAVEQQRYRFNQLKTEKDKSQNKRLLRKITLMVNSRKELDDAEQASLHGQAIAQGVKFTRDLANLPPNICTPSYLASQGKQLCMLHENLSCAVLDEADMEELGMGALLGVARGSREPAKLISLHYQGGDKSEKPVVLVGKGVTFDAGGISLKPGAAMDEMKYDMCGAASVFGTLATIAQMRLPINLVGLMPCTENLPDGNALKPSDILTSLSGKTIEILNTDAEGRLVLCDALTYSAKYEPAVVIDIATLTGACVIALGKVAHGLFSNHSPLVSDLLAAGQQSADRAWEMPLWDDYQELLDSPFADMTNVGGRPAGSISAACFLSRFTKDYQWAHLDIAGTAWVSGSPKKKGATGRPVALLTQYLLNRLEKQQNTNNA